MPSRKLCMWRKVWLEHALSCKKGGFVTNRHNQVRNITATLLNEIYNDVQIEPQLQSLSGKYFDAKTANKHEDARLTIRQEDFGVMAKKDNLTSGYSTQ